MRLEIPQLMPEEPQCPHSHSSVHQPKQQAGANQTQLRHQHQRKGQRHRQRAQVVKGQHLRDQLFERDVAPQNAHDQRNLQPHQRTHQQHQRVQQKAKSPRYIRISYKKQSGKRTTYKGHQQFYT